MEKHYGITKIENGYILNYPGPKKKFQVESRLRKFFENTSGLLKFLKDQMIEPEIPGN